MLKYLDAAASILVAAACLLFVISFVAPSAPKTVCVAGSLSSTGKIYVPRGVRIVTGGNALKCKMLAR